MTPWIETCARLGPLVLAAWRATLPYAPLIVHAVIEAERLPGAHGADKKAYALGLVDAIVARLNAADATTPIDPHLAHEIADIAIDALVATINLWSRNPIGA